MGPAFIAQSSTQYTADKFIVYGISHGVQRDDTLRLGDLTFSVYGVLPTDCHGPSTTHQVSLVLHDYTGQSVIVDKGACLYQV